jgi:hypothetical protein
MNPSTMVENPLNSHTVRTHNEPVRIRNLEAQFRHISKGRDGMDGFGASAPHPSEAEPAIAEARPRRIVTARKPRPDREWKQEPIAMIVHAPSAKSKGCISKYRRPRIAERRAGLPRTADPYSISRPRTTISVVAKIGRNTASCTWAETAR